MNKYLLNLSLLGLTAIAANTHAISLDFNSISSGPSASTRGSIQFDGPTDTFKFIDVTANVAGKGFSFAMSGSDGTGDSFGDYGRIDGIFKIGAITTVGTKQTAPVTLSSGAGLFIIDDGDGFELTGKISWVEIFTDGTAGGLNLSGVINLTDISYSGAELDLQALGNQATAALQFGFNPAKSLSQLTASAGQNTSTFTGDIAATPTPDGGSTSILLGMALLGMVGTRRKLQR